MARFQPGPEEVTAWAEAADEAAARHGDNCEECAALWRLYDYLVAVEDAGVELPAVDLD